VLNAPLPRPGRTAADPDWGYMINEGRTFIYTQWWISTFPGITVMLTGLAFGVLGDGLGRRAGDTALKG